MRVDVMKALRAMSAGSNVQTIRDGESAIDAIAELIAADEEYDAALKIHNALRDGVSTLGEVCASDAGLHRASARRAAALLACKGQDHER